MKTENTQETSREARMQELLEAFAHCFGYPEGLADFEELDPIRLVTVGMMRAVEDLLSDA